VEAGSLHDVGLRIFGAREREKQGKRENLGCMARVSQKKNVARRRHMCQVCPSSQGGEDRRLVESARTGARGHICVTYPGTDREEHSSRIILEIVAVLGPSTVPSMPIITPAE